MKKFWIGIFAFMVTTAGLFLAVSGKLSDVGIFRSDNLIVIDAGHGGFDPGKVGINDALEKDINLSIALKLKKLLVKKGYQVLLTREEDCALSEEGEGNKKRSDMNKRVKIINESQPLLAVSIHQNSFGEASSHGAQVFYHNQSEEGKKLAETLQAVIKNEIADNNHREAKANDTYFMLKQTKCPLVIVECGFLSNPTEADLLLTEEYQDRMAEAVYKGLLSYLGAKETTKPDGLS